MDARESWDWQTPEKTIPYAAWRDNYQWVEEPQVSPDGEQIAAIVNIAEGEFNVCVNGDAWENSFDKIWYLRYSPDGRLTALVSDTGEWTVAVDGTAWENRFSYAWDTQFSDDGRYIAVAFQQDMTYGMALNDRPWSETFANMTEPRLSADGSRTAAAVQVQAFGEGDIDTFQKGAFSVAVDGQRWDTRFVNVWKLAVAPAADILAAEVRLNLYDYTIAVNGTAWERTFDGVWEPSVHPVSRSVMAPVRVDGKWTLAQDGEILWDARFFQLWHQLLSPDGNQTAAIVAPKYGRWTIAVDGRPWKTSARDMVSDAIFSPDGRRVAALFKNGDRWSVAVNDNLWKNAFDMAFAPVFSPDGNHVAVRVEKDGTHGFAINDRIFKQGCDGAWDPVFSPGGDKLLLKTIEDGIYRRRIVRLTDLI